MYVCACVLTTFFSSTVFCLPQCERSKGKTTDCQRAVGRHQEFDKTHQAPYAKQDGSAFIWANLLVLRLLAKLLRVSCMTPDAARPGNQQNYYFNTVPWLRTQPSYLVVPQWVGSFIVSRSVNQEKRSEWRVLCWYSS